MKTLFTAGEIAAQVSRVAAEVQAHFGMQEPVYVLTLLNGALWFAADLLRCLPPNYIIQTVRVSSYGLNRTSSGRLTWQTPPPDVRGKRVLVADDVLDSGLTLHAVCTALREQGAAEVRTAVAVSKQGCRTIPFEADFAAFHAADVFLVGYGMDDAERYRNLPYIAQV